MTVLLLDQIYAIFTITLKIKQAIKNYRTKLILTNLKIWK